MRWNVELTLKSGKSVTVTDLEAINWKQTDGSIKKHRF
jgi:hypothetical protein